MPFSCFLNIKRRVVLAGYKNLYPAKSVYYCLKQRSYGGNYWTGHGKIDSDKAVEK